MGTPDDRTDDKSISAVEVSNSGQFVATIILWPADPKAPTNPGLISPARTELSVEDSHEYTPPTST